VIALREPAWVRTIEHALKVRRHWQGVNRFPEPERYFGPGGVEEAEAFCAEVNRDLLEWIAPPADPPRIERLDRRDVGSRFGRMRVEEIRFDSPDPSGDEANDRVQVRVYRHAATPVDGRVILFHHPIYQKDWTVWTWFLAPLIRLVPVAMMAAPHHFDRVGPARYPGEMSMNPNPALLFRAIRQWCADHTATVRMLDDTFGLRTSGIVGYSFGAFQALLLAAGGRIDVPIVSIASTNRYAFGLQNGSLGKGMLEGMGAVGIDRERLDRMVESLQLERHVGKLRDHDVLYVRGVYDAVDPFPSLVRLERALAPRRSIRLGVGHATVVFRRDRVVGETTRFLREHGAIPHGADREPDSLAC